MLRVRRDLDWKSTRLIHRFAPRPKVLGPWTREANAKKLIFGPAICHSTPQSMRAI